MLNKTIIQGRLTADPELRQTQSGVNVLNFTVAWSEKRNEIENKCFLNCVAWNKTAEFINNYFQKGQEIAIEGRLLTRQWVSDDGNNHYAIELTVEGVHFCGSKQANQTSAAADNTSANILPNGSDFANQVSEEELPF